MLTRREFISEAGYVAFLLVPVASGCGSSNSSSGGPSGCDGVGATSSVALGHSHTVCVPAADLSAPPQGGGTFTTSGPDPTHTITLSAAQLSAMAQGQSVSVTTSNDGAHTHDFMLQKTASAEGQERTSRKHPLASRRG